MRGDPRSTRRYQQISAAVIAAFPHMGPCGICYDPVDKTLRYPDLMSPSTDAIREHANGGSHFDPRNLRVTHLDCNRKRGASLGGQRAAAKRRPARRSRHW